MLEGPGSSTDSFRLVVSAEVLCLMSSDWSSLGLLVSCSSSFSDLFFLHGVFLCVIFDGLNDCLSPPPPLELLFETEFFLE